MRVSAPEPLPPPHAQGSFSLPGALRKIVIPSNGHKIQAAIFYLVSGLVSAAALVLVFGHISDRYRVSQVTGAWLGLAYYAAEGTLYPPLFDGQYYGGTRFMPIPIVMQGALARVTGEVLFSSKLIAGGVTAVLAGVMVRAFRGWGHPWPTALVLGTCFLASESGLEAACNFRGDGLAVLFQIMALLMIRWEDRTTQRVLLAGFLAGIAAMSKLTAIWAPAAIVVFLLWRNRRHLALFLLAFLGVVAIGLVVFSWMSDGRMAENILGLAGSGIESPLAIFKSPGVFLYFVQNKVTLVGALFPLVLVSLAKSLGLGRLSLFDLGWLAAFGLLLFMLADPGVGSNHFLDVLLLSCLCIGERWADELREGTWLAVCLSAVIAWGTLSSFDASVSGDFRATLKGKLPFPTQPLADLIEPTDKLISEDATIPILMGQRPILVDAWILLRIGRQHPEYIKPLISQIRAQTFDKVVLLRPADDPTDWFVAHEFGENVRRALAENYVLWRVRDGYYVHVPKRAAEGLGLPEP